MSTSADDSGFWGLPKTDEEWTEFLKQNGPKLYWFLLRKLGNHQDAEDCLQQMFVKFFNYINNYDQSRPLLSYLYGIADNVFFDFVKDRKQFLNPPPDAGSNLKFDKSEEKQQPFNFVKERVNLSFREQQLVDFVKEQADLDESQCELFVMLVFHELSPKEIACILGINSKGARQRIWRLRKLLRDRLDRDDFSSPWY